MELAMGVLLIVAICAAGAWLWRRKGGGLPMSVPAPTMRPDASFALSAKEPPQGRPTQILIGERRETPIVSIQLSDAATDYKEGKALDIRSGPISKLSAALQAAPSVLVAAENYGKRLMEVTINGGLTRAADGNGLRAFATDGKHITENARLFEVNKLSTMINAAAVWQIASVVVAQKHLADISKKLGEIKASLEVVAHFLDDQRRARIESTYSYLVQVSESIRAGELSSSVRDKFEDFEQEMLEIQAHLLMEFRRTAEKSVEHADTVGTEELTAAISEKIRMLRSIYGDLHLCLRTRVGAWHLLSVFPGEPHLVDVRRKGIESSILQVRDLTGVVLDETDREIARVKSIWNKEETLEERRRMLRMRRDSVLRDALEGADGAVSTIESTAQLLLAHDQPTRILVEINNGTLVGARLAR